MSLSSGQRATTGRTAFAIFCSVDGRRTSPWGRWLVRRVHFGPQSGFRNHIFQIPPRHTTHAVLLHRTLLLVTDQAYVQLVGGRFWPVVLYLPLDMQPESLLQHSSTPSLPAQPLRPLARIMWCRALCSTRLRTCPKHRLDCPLQSSSSTPQYRVNANSHSSRRLRVNTLGFLLSACTTTS